VLNDSSLAATHCNTQRRNGGATVAAHMEHILDSFNFTSGCSTALTSLFCSVLMWCVVVSMLQCDAVC